MAAGFRPVDASDNPEDFELWRTSFFLYEVFGAAAMVPNVLLFFVLVSYKSHRRDLKLPILLCISDTTNCLAILILGAHSVEIYNRAIRDNIVPVETALSCALSAPVYLRIIGSVMSPLVHTAIAFDRFVCVKFPMWYRPAIAKRQYLLPLLVVVAVFIFLPIGFYLAYWRRHDTVKFYCGRRASFGQVYSMMIYTFLVFGYFLSFMANMFTFLMIRTSNRQNKSFVRTLKIATAASFVSFLLISIPNTSSFVDTVFRISPLALQITTYLGVIAYSLTFFLYLVLNPDFRRRTLHRLTCGFAKIRVESQLPGDFFEKKSTFGRA